MFTYRTEQKLCQPLKSILSLLWTRWEPLSIKATSGIYSNPQSEKMLDKVFWEVFQNATALVGIMGESFENARFIVDMLQHATAWHIATTF